VCFVVDVPGSDNERLMDYRSPFRFSGRLYMLAGIGYCVMLLLLVKLIWIQVYHNEHFLDKSKRIYSAEKPIPAERGRILDRNGVVMAAQLPGSYALTVKPQQLKGNPGELASACATILERPSRPLAVQMRVTDRQTVYVASELTIEQRDTVSSMLKDRFPDDAAAFDFENFPRRCYPAAEAGAQLIGYVNQEGLGVCGIEAALDSLLCGEAGLRVYGRDSAGQPFDWQQGRHLAPVNGATINLTLDSRIQAIMQEEMIATCREYRAASATGIIMNPATGEILAMGSWPTFDPNTGIRHGENGLLRNRAVSDSYEPGSTFKTFTFAQLLEEHNLNLADSVDCQNGSWNLGKWVINDSHIEGHGLIPAAEVYYESSNIGTALLAEQIEARSMYAFVRSLGFGQYTGIDLPGEVQGRLQPLRRWRRVEKANISFGQGIAVTPLQLAVAYSALFNGGRIMRPYVIQSLWKDDRLETTRPLVRRRVLSGRTLAELQDLMAGVVEQGTGQSAAIPGLIVRGKTGTAQKIAQDGGYSNEDYIASFAGAVDIGNRTYLGLMLVDTPRESIWGGTVAGNLFSHVFSRVRHLNNCNGDAARVVMKDLEELQQLPDCYSLDVEELRRTLRRAGVDNYSLQGEGQVVSQNPAPGGYTVMPAVNFLLAETGAVDSLQVPDLQGLGIRDAVTLASQSGLQVTFRGDGKVRQQTPVAGKWIGRKQICQLVLR